MPATIEVHHRDLIAEDALQVLPIHGRLEEAAIRLSTVLMGGPTFSMHGRSAREILGIGSTRDQDYIRALTGLQDALRDLDKHRKLGSKVAHATKEPSHGATPKQG